MNEMPEIKRVVVLGGGSAGLIAALTLKVKLPALDVEVVRSPEIGIIGVGEGTTAAFPRHFFEYLKLPPQEFYAGAAPTYKLGIHFLWGTNPHGFYYSFHAEYRNRWPEMGRNTGFYVNNDTRWTGIISACMAHDIAFPRKPDGSPHVHNNHAFHIENENLVKHLDTWCRKHGVRITDATVQQVETGGEGVAALHLEDGRKFTADLFVDASGFRSELLGRALGQSYTSYADSLFCDRAVIAGWPRTTEPIRSCTVAETMNAGWCWQIEHENWINRGYVYSSAFLSDDEALREFREKNPKIANEPRVVKFRSGRYERLWQGNVVGIGNSFGFVEPLEATALAMVCVQSSTLTDSLLDSQRRPTATMKEMYNRYNVGQWDEIRDFLAVHYKYNRRQDTPFWRACQEDTVLGGAVDVVRFYKDNGPSIVAEPMLLHPANSFGMEGYLAMLVGQNVPHARPYTPTPAEARIWKERMHGYGEHARAGFSVKQMLEMTRQHGVAANRTR